MKGGVRGQQDDQKHRPSLGHSAQQFRYKPQSRFSLALCLSVSLFVLSVCFSVPLFSLSLGFSFSLCLFLPLCFLCLYVSSVSVCRLLAFSLGCPAVIKGGHNRTEKELFRVHILCIGRLRLHHATSIPFTFYPTAPARLRGNEEKLHLVIYSKGYASRITVVIVHSRYSWNWSF